MWKTIRKIDTEITEAHKIWSNKETSVFITFGFEVVG